MAKVQSAAMRVRSREVPVQPPAPSSGPCFPRPPRFSTCVYIVVVVTIFRAEQSKECSAACANSRRLETE